MSPRTTNNTNNNNGNGYIKSLPSSFLSSDKANYSSIPDNTSIPITAKFNRNAYTASHPPLSIQNLHNLFPTPKNAFKLLISFLIWLSTYVIMGVLGGAVAYWRFPRLAAPSLNPEPLPDVLFEFVFTKQVCYRVGSLNLQSAVLVAYYGYLLVYTVFVNKRNEGRIILIRFYLINALMFLTRTTTVSITSLPNPNYTNKCIFAQNDVVDNTFMDAVEVVWKSFPPKSCGDLIYSGHVSCAVIACLLFLRHEAFPTEESFARFFRFFEGVEDSNDEIYDIDIGSTISCASSSTNVTTPQSSSNTQEKFSKFCNIKSITKTTMFFLLLVSVCSVLTCRSHYSVDVVLGAYFSFFLCEFYFNRSLKRGKGRGRGDRGNGRITRFIVWIEGRDDDDDDGGDNLGDANEDDEDEGEQFR